MAHEPEIGDAELIARLMGSGIPEVEAHELVAFVPLAFARYALKDSGVKFRDSYVLHSFGKVIAIGLLSAEAAYSSAWSVAEEFFESSRKSGNYLAIAGRSAELRAINGLLDKGSKLENILLSEPLVCLPLRTQRERPSLWKTLRWLFRA